MPTTRTARPSAGNTSGPTGEVILTSTDYSDTSLWEVDNTVTEQLATYKSNFENMTVFTKEWETGGGWLRTKTYHTEVTIEQGQKDYYTHALKADYAIGVQFVGGTASTINLSSRGDLLVQGNVTVAHGGSVILNSDDGSVTGGETVAIFNDAPTVTAGLDVRLIVEGGVDVLHVHAGRNITITGVADVATLEEPVTTSALTLGQVVSDAGNTTLTAADGLRTRSDPLLTFVQGNRVELSASGVNADIGGANALRVNSNTLLTGGLAVKAGDDINILETTGDLKLIRALTFTSTASVQGGGDVTLATASGSILDATLELPQMVNSDPITPQQQKMMDQLNGVIPVSFVDTAVTTTTVGGTLVFALPAGHQLTHLQEVSYRHNVVTGEAIVGLEEEETYFLIIRSDGMASLAATLAQAQAGTAIAISLDTVDDANGVTGTGHRIVGHVYDTDAQNDISESAFTFPISPGLYSYLYPQAQFLGLTPVVTAPEVMNVIGDNVTLVAVDGTGSIGRSKAAQVISLAGGFEPLSDADKEVLATATASDVYGVQYATYRYVGPNGASGANLKDQDFGNTSNWQKVTYVATGAIKAAAPSSQAVAANGYVLVEFNGIHGLYQYNGTSGSLNLRTENFSNQARWTKVDTTTLRSTADSGAGTLTQGQLVLNKAVVERVALQLKDDVDVKVNGALVAEADGNIALESPIDLTIAKMRAGGDVLIKGGGNILDAGTDPFAAIGAFGDLTVVSNGVMRGEDVGDTMRIALSTSSHLFLDVIGDIDVTQVAGDLTIDSNTQAISSLYVARVTTSAHADITVTLGDMTVEHMDAALGGSLVAQGSIIDAFDDVGGPVVNVTTGDLYLQAGSDIGTSGNFFDVLVSGNLSGLAGNDVFINSPDTLNITTLVSTAGDVTLTVQGDTNIGQIRARLGTVTIDSDDDIVDRYDDAAADIEAISTDLTAVAGGIGFLENPFDIDTSFAGTMGTVNALALSTVYMIETAGAMRIDKVRSQADDVTLRTLAGSIAGRERAAGKQRHGPQRQPRRQRRQHRHAPRRARDRLVQPFVASRGAECRGD